MATNRYIDTRGRCAAPVTFTEAVVKGLAEGGGLFVPETLPKLSLESILSLAEIPYAKRAAFIYRSFGIDLPDAKIDELMDATYGDRFDNEAICPITSLDENTHVLELWHGPTSAFKDMALQCLPHFFSASASQLREQGKLENTFLILVATSGDTGKAALEGFRDKDGVQIAVMYPDGGVSDIQYKQMATQAGSNVMVWAVKGNFDDCQTGAKNVFGDEAFAEKLMDSSQVALSSANSINWGRLLPQVVYYVSSYAELVAQGKLEAGKPLDVCVPTGNFLTPSPSMDILVSSNVERQLFELTGRNADAIAAWMEELKANKSFTVDTETLSKLQADFKSDSVDSETCLNTIKEVLDKHNYLIDPHTAVACKVAERLHGENPVLIASTAHWAKFGENVYRALHDIAPGEPLPESVAELSGCALNDLIANEANGHNIPKGLAELDSLPIRFEDVIEGNTAAIEEAVLDFLK